MKVCLITGAYGLVGSNLCKLLESYPEIHLVKVKYDIIPDIQADYIIHAAGYGQPLKFSTDKLETININTLVTRKLFSCLKPQGKFLFVSTSEVYSGAEIPYKEEVMGTTTPQHPRACYIEGKRCGEAICMAYKEQGFDVKIARLSLAYGATKLGDTRVLNQFIEQGLKGKIILKDAGIANRTYCYVEDACELMLKILFFGKDVVYNVGGFSTITIAELAEQIGKLMNATVSIPKSESKIQGAPDNVCLDMSHTLKEFDQHFTPLLVGLKKTIAQYAK
jgi:nucleoside-diphosphate-sugar epimerase